MQAQLQVGWESPTCTLQSLQRRAAASQARAAAALGEAPGAPGAPAAPRGQRVRPSIAVPAAVHPLAGAVPDFALALESPFAAPSPVALNGSLLFPISPQRSLGLT